MDPVALLREAVADSHASLERTVDGLDQAALDWAPDGTAIPIGATLAHVIVSEDMVVNAILAASSPLLRSSHAGRTGLSEPMPTPGPEWAAYGDWARRLRVDMPALMAYAHAVWASTDAFLAGLGAEDVGRDVDMSLLGRGHITLGFAILRMTCAHTDQITGEISAIKGLQGRGGYG